MQTIAIISNHTSDLLHFKRELIVDLQKQEVQVYAFAPNYTGETEIEIQELGAIPIRYFLKPTGLNPIKDFICFVQLFRRLRKIKPNIVLMRAVKPIVYGAIASRLCRISRRVSLVEGLGYVFTSSDNKLSFKQKVLRGLVKRMYVVGLSSSHIAATLNPDDEKEIASWGVSRSKLLMVGGTGVDLRKWQTVPVVQKPFTFLLTARLLKEKGVLEYVEAARVLKKERPDSRFILLGGVDPNPGSITEAQIQAWVEEGMIEWHGHTAVEPWMRQTSVFVLPSYYREGVPVSIQEAMAMGRPIITTDAPGCRETVEDGVNGFLVAVRDVQSLVAKMREFMQNPGLIEKMGKESRRLAEEKFDRQKNNEKLISILLKRNTM